jgi:hypothetical protein
MKLTAVLNDSQGARPSNVRVERQPELQALKP